MREILAYDLNSEVVHSLTKVPKEYLLSSLGGGGQVAIWQADNDGSTVVAYTNVAEKNIMPPKEIMRLNRHLSHVLMPEQVNLRYKGPDGDEYNSCLLMPPPDMVRRPLPTIVEVYPFATGSCYGATSPYWHNPFVWPSAGYAYLRVGVHTGVRHPITKEFLDMRRWIYPAIDKAVEQGYADNNKLALIGISQGSIVALEVLTKSKRFGVSLVAHGMANYSSLWGEFGFASSSLYFDRFPPGMEMPRFEDPTNVLWLGGAPWEEADSYTKITPLYSASQIQTPIFFLHSDVDSFNLSHFQEMYAALHRLDKPVTMVYYEGEAHGLDSPANIRDAYYRVTKWMGRHLEVFSAADPNKANAAR